MNITEDKLNYIAAHTDTIEEAWTKIETNRHRSVIILDGNKVVGTLSDGDIRKAILAKRLLSTPVAEIMNLNFVSLKAEERKIAIKKFKEKDIFLIPMVDDALNLIDIIIR
jgi:D-glycero-alpha-D-manno-heptose-7-phosphate kinase